MSDIVWLEEQERLTKEKWERLLALAQKRRESGSVWVTLPNGNAVGYLTTEGAVKEKND